MRPKVIRVVVCALLIVGYYGVSFYGLWFGIPIWEDGDGPTASLFYGKYPHSYDWLQHRANPQLGVDMIKPYFPTAFVVALNGIFAYLFASRITSTRRHRWAVLVGANVILFLLCAELFDLGIAFGLWRGGRWLWSFRDSSDFVVGTMVPLAIYASLFSSVADRYLNNAQRMTAK